MSSRPSLTARALVALALMVGFYLLALLIVAALVGAIYAEVKAERFYWVVTAGAVVGIYAILTGIIPRRRKFTVPGPLLTHETQPRLLAEIRTVSDATGSAMPREVYLAPDVNAGVAHIGGFAGIGSRPIMIVGLPLMAALTHPEFRGVIAHEFGHYAGGETKLAPLVYRTREAIFRTVHALAKRGRRYLHLPFLWYGQMYLRITLSISRRQELAADAHAAAIAGGDSMETGLIKTHAAGLALGGFYDHELVPVVIAGYRPPMAEGFVRFLHGDSMSEYLDATTQKEMTSGRSDPYDSHPSLHERIEALRRISHPAASVPDTPAIDLLDDVPKLEATLLSGLLQRDVAALPAIAWEDAVTRVWIEGWVEACKVHEAALAGITPGSLPDVAADIGPYIERVPRPKPGEQRIDILRGVVGAALAVTLARKGWSIEADPGEPVTATRGEAVIRTFAVLPDLMQHTLSPEDWRRTCSENGIADLNLSEAADDPAAPPDAEASEDGWIPGPATR